MTDDTLAGVLAWHFLPSDGLTRFKPREAVHVGQTLVVAPPLCICNRGLHASRRPLDAMNYIDDQSPIICRVLCEGEIVEQIDKLCAERRTVIAMADATKTLHEFAVWCAEQALTRERNAGGEPDERSWAALEVKRRWLRGEATDEELAAARDAAWAAARAAAWDAAGDAAGAAAWAAARDAAWAAARAAAWDAAGDAAGAAAWDAARAAARAAAWDAAWDAARAAYNAELERRFLELLGITAETRTPAARDTRSEAAQAEGE